MTEFQKTLSETVKLLPGINLFNANKIEGVEIHPAAPDTGLAFIVRGERIPATLANVVRKPNRTPIERINNFLASIAQRRISSISLKNANGENTARLVEHMLSPFYALGCVNANINLGDNDVCPTYNDIAQTVYDAVSNKLIEQNVPMKFYRVKPSGFDQHLRPPKPDRIQAWRTDATVIQYIASKGYPSIGPQDLIYRQGIDNYREEIAQARTYCFPEYKAVYRLIKKLGEMGLHGATDKNCAFVLKHGEQYANLIEPNERYEHHEFVAHKMLDLFGELAIAGLYLKQTHLTVTQTGHETVVEGLSRLCDPKAGYLEEVPSTD